MFKLFKYAILALISMALLLILGIALFFALNDANKFKPDIEMQAKEHVGLNLNIEGQLSWSLLPLGILIEKIQLLDQNLDPFARVETISTQVDLISIFVLSPKIKSIFLSGLELELVVNDKGEANWDNILPSQKIVTSTETELEKPNSKPEQKKNINFLIETFEINNSKVQFRSLQDKTNIAVNDIQLQTSNVALDGETPFSLQFELVDANDNFNIITQLSATLALSNNLESIALQKFTSSHQISGNTLKTPIALGFDANIYLTNVSPGGQVELKDLRLKIDDSTWQGQLRFGMDDQAVQAQLNGDHINLDHYLTSEPTPSKSKDTQPKSDATTSDNTLLPLATLRKLKLDIKLMQQELIVNQLKSTTIESHFRADKGLLELVALSGKLYQGDYKFSAKIDARGADPLWSSKQSVSHVNIAPIAEILGKIDRIAGKLTLNASAQSKGNSLEQLQAKATAQATFNIEDGHLAGFNANQLACEGFALLNRDAIGAREWPEYTPFALLEGQASLKQQQVQSTLNIVASGLKVKGNGNLDLQREEVDYRARVNVVGELGEHACRVNDKLKEVGIPVRCQGSLNSDPATLCKLDKSALNKELKSAAVNEGKRKLDKEVDRALDKYLGGEEGNKKSIKNLLNKLF